MPETAHFDGDNPSNNIIEGSLQVGEILLTRYKILGYLNSGGQGVVYQARDLNFPDARRLVAIKEMRISTNDSKTNADTLKTFRREANILATLSHPTIPRIYDFFDQNNRAYLVMEYINGHDVEALLNRTKTLPINKILDWAIDLCDVLSYLHQQPEPIIFRDMKPANIMVDGLGKVRLIDFGIAKIFVQQGKHTNVGTEGYSAPEQYKGIISPLSDIYSLGATLHHIIAREDPRFYPPFTFSSRPIQQHNPEASAALASIIDKALSFEPENRWKSCELMKEALLQVRYTAITSSEPSMGINTTPAIGTDTPNVTAAFGTGVSGGIQAQWEFKTEDEIRCSPTSHNNMAFVGSYDTNVWALDLETGEQIWAHSTEGGIASSPVVDTTNNLVLFGSEDTVFRAVDLITGRLVWSCHTDGKIRSAPFLGENYVFFGSDDNHLYALFAATGREQWAFDAGAEIRCRPYVTEDRIIFGTEDGEIYGLEMNGTKKWSLRTKRAVISSPVVDIENTCFVGSFDSYLHAIDSVTGYSAWRVRTNGPIISSPVVADERVFFGSTDGTLYAINTQTGREIWRFSVDQPFVGSPCIHKRVIYIGGTDGILYCVDIDTGKEVWQFKTQGPITSKPHIADKVILLGSMDYKLYALPLIEL